MIALHAQHKYYLYGQPTDMRKSFDGLSGLVRNHLRRNPTSGEVYVFLNRKRDMIKVLLGTAAGLPFTASGWSGAVLSARAGKIAPQVSS